MPQMQDDAGNIWEVDAQGNVLGLAKPAASAAPTPMTFGTPDPTKAAAERRANEAASRSAAADARAAAAADRTAREWSATHNPDGTPKKGGTTGGKPLPDSVAKRYEQAIDAFADYDRAVGGFKDDYAGNTLTGGLENTAQSLLGVGTPGQAQWWSDFAATDNMIRNALFGASLTAGEKAAYERTSIKPSMKPSEIRANLERRMTLAKEKLGRRTTFLKANGYDPDAVDALAGEYGEMLRDGATGQRAPREDDPAKLAGVATDPNSPPPDNSPPGLPPANAPGAQDTTPLGIASGSTRTVPNERANGLINSLMNAGASKGMIDAMLAKQGLPPVKSAEYLAAKVWMKNNPGKRYAAANATDLVPLSMMERAAGSTAGSAVANYADAATAGISTALAGDRGRGALDAMNATNPNAAAVGSVLGGVTGAGAAELGAARMLAPGLARFAPRVGDALYGATQGGTTGGDLQSAAMGAGAGVLGGVVGERAMRGAGAAFRGVTDPMVQTLREAGVPMTVGQALSQSGTLGRTVKGIEDRLAGLPIVGDIINTRRREGIEGFNNAAFDVGAELTGNQVQDYGSAGIQQLDALKNNAYDNALGGVTIDANDPQFFADLVATRRSVNAIPNVNGAQDAANAGLQARIDGAIDPMTDQISGRNFQEAYRGLARTGRERANGDYGHEVGQVMRQGQDALSGALERQNPGAFQDFADANATNRRLMVLADAVGKGKNTDELFTPAQLNMADSASTRRLTGPLAAASGDRPFYDLATAGQAVLPSKVPDSGTAGRMMTGLMLGGGAMGAGGYAAGGGEGAATGLGATLALAAGGTQGVQRMATRALLDRPDVALRIGEELRRRAAIGGAAGGGILAQIVAGQ